MAWISTLTVLLLLASAASAGDPQALIYGKYFSVTDGGCQDKCTNALCGDFCPNLVEKYDCGTYYCPSCQWAGWCDKSCGYCTNSSVSQAPNTAYLFTPETPAGSKVPVVIQIHGGGFTGGSANTQRTAEIDAITSAGIAYVSVNYRLVATRYYYGNDKKLEELIHVDHEGRLTLDTTGKTADQYQIRRGRTEYNTKCSYDAARMIDYLVEHAEELGLDMHRVSFTGGSAGGGEIHYLTWVYHQWNTDKYTPRGMVYTMAQLDYPVQNMMDRVWSLWTADVGQSLKLNQILDYTDCGMIIGNPWCVSPGVNQSEYNLCNMSWQKESMARFCTNRESFDKATLGEVQVAQRWPREDPEVISHKPVTCIASRGSWLGDRLGWGWKFYGTPVPTCSGTSQGLFTSTSQTS